MAVFKTAGTDGRNKQFERGTTEQKIERNTAMPSPDLRDTYHTSTVNNEKVPYENLSVYVDGYEPWGVTYYKQTLGEDDEVRAYDSSLNAVHQQYMRVDDFEIKVVDPITHEYNKDEQRQYFTGAGLILASTLIPNRHDVFIARILGDTDMMFTITDVTPLSHMTETVYRVTYISIVADVEGLEKKVVYESSYSRENLIQGGKPILNKLETTLKNRLEEVGHSLLQMYIDDFSNKQYLMLPNQNEDIIDLYVMAFWYGFLNVSDYNKLRDMRWFDREYVEGGSALTIWDAIVRRDAVADKGMKHRMAPKMHLVSCSDHSTRYRNASLGGVYYTTVDWLVLPETEGCRTEPFDSLVESKLRSDDFSEITPDANHIDLSDIEEARLPRSAPPIFPVNKDEYYIFTQAFYDSNTQRMSSLELLVYDYLDGKPINTECLMNLSDMAFRWGDLERFYYVPILMKLIDSRLEAI